MRAWAWAALATIAAAAAGAGGARAQSCCSPATTPSAAVEHAALTPGNFQVGVYAEHFLLSGGRRGTEDFDFPGDRRANAQVVSLAARAGLTGRLSAAVLVPFNRRERSDRTPDGGRVHRAHSGLGDVVLLGYWRMLPALRPREWTVGLGWKLATGESRVEDATGELPEELQPGTGANDVLLTTHFSQALGRITAGAGLTWRLPGTQTKIDVFPTGDGDANEIERKFRFGNELLYGAALAWSPDDRWGFEIGVRGRHAGADENTALNPDGTTGDVETLPSTGGDRVWLAPTLRYAPANGRTAVSVGALLPVYENLTGSQLATKPGLRLAVEGRP